jgi:hypothetical protein
MTAALLTQDVLELNSHNRKFFGIPKISVQPEIQSFFSVILNRFIYGYFCLTFQAVIKNTNRFHLKQ